MTMNVKTELGVLPPGSVFFNRILIAGLTLSFCIDRIKVGEDGYHGTFGYFFR